MNKSTRRRRHYTELVRTSTSTSERSTSRPTSDTGSAVTDQNVVVFARSNHDTDAIQRQVDDLRAYAARHGYRIVGEVGLRFTSANDPQVEQALAGLLASRSEGPQAKALLVTDLSRLTRNIHQWPILQRRIAEAGWKIVIADRRGDGPVQLGQFFLAGEKVNEVVHANEKEGRGATDPQGDVRRRGRGVQDEAQRPRPRTGRARTSAKGDK